MDAVPSSNPNPLPAPDPFILALGDSLTAGYGLPPGASFADRLEARLRETHPRARVHNGGVSGDTAGAALHRLPHLLSSLAVRPALAIVELGANDAIRGIPPQRTQADLDALVAELRRCRIDVLLATVDPPAFLGAFGDRYARVYDEVVARHGVRRHPFFPTGLLGHPDYVLPDRLHPSAGAIDLVARHMLPAVLAALAAPSMAEGMV